MKRKLVAFLLLLVCFCTVALAHSGRTDGQGGHYDHSTGEYHFHHGYPAHQHINGECPYDFKDRTDHSGGGGSSTKKDNTKFEQKVTPKPTKATPKPTKKPTPKPTAKPKPTLRPKATVTVKHNTLPPTAEPIVRRTAPAAKEDDEVTLLQAVLMAGGGVFVCYIATKSVLKKQYEDKCWNRENSIKRESSNEIAQKNSEIMRKNSEIAQKNREIDALKGNYAASVAEMDKLKQTLEYRRGLQQKLISTIDAASSPVSQALEIPNCPDTSKGVVYVRRDFKDKLYHHDPGCRRGLVLASKVFIDGTDLQPCACCSVKKQPDMEYTVSIGNSPGILKYYHAEHNMCLKNGGLRVPLSEAKSRGLAPCKKCNPPAENPIVWF